MRKTIRRRFGVALEVWWGGEFGRGKVASHQKGPSKRGLVFEKRAVDVMR